MLHFSDTIQMVRLKPVLQDHIYFTARPVRHAGTTEPTLGKSPWFIP